MGGDSNPRYLAVNTLSRRAQSTTLPPILRLMSSGRLMTPAGKCGRHSGVKMAGIKSDVLRALLSAEIKARAEGAAQKNEAAPQVRNRLEK